MQFFKTNIFGILALLIGLLILVNTIININEILEYHKFTSVGEYIDVEKNVESSIMKGGLKITLIFLFFLLIPVVLSIIHKRRKANKIVFYLALSLVLINFLVYPYFLMLLSNTINII